MRLNLIIDATPLNGAGVPLARPDAHHVRERENEYLAIAHFAGVRGFLNRIDHLIDQCVGHGDFDLGLRHELDDVLCTPVNLGVPRCRPKPRTSVTVMPCTPMSLIALRTSSSLKGLITAQTSFIDV